MPFIANSMVVEMRTTTRATVVGQCFVCPSHTIDGFIKNALSDTDTIRIQANEMSHVEFTTMVIFRKITSQPEFSQVDVTETLKNADTRVGSKVIMGRHLLSTKSIYRNLFRIQ
jgi:hypothetical protein